MFSRGDHSWKSVKNERNRAPSEGDRARPVSPHCLVEAQTSSKPRTGRITPQPLRSRTGAPASSLAARVSGTRKPPILPVEGCASARRVPATCLGLENQHSEFSVCFPVTEHESKLGSVGLPCVTILTICGKEVGQGDGVWNPVLWVVWLLLGCSNITTDGQFTPHRGGTGQSPRTALAIRCLVRRPLLLGQLTSLSILTDKEPGAAASPQSTADVHVGAP